MQKKITRHLISPDPIGGVGESPKSTSSSLSARVSAQECSAASSSPVVTIVSAQLYKKSWIIYYDTPNLKNINHLWVHNFMAYLCIESMIDSAKVFSWSSWSMLLLPTKVPEWRVDATEWNWSGIPLDLAEANEWPEPLWRIEERTEDGAAPGWGTGSSAHDKNSSCAIDPPGTRLEDDDFDT